MKKSIFISIAFYALTGTSLVAFATDWVKLKNPRNNDWTYETNLLSVTRIDATKIQAPLQTSFGDGFFGMRKQVETYEIKCKEHALRKVHSETYQVDSGQPKIEDTPYSTYETATLGSVLDEFIGKACNIADK